MFRLRSPTEGGSREGVCLRSTRPGGQGRYIRPPGLSHRDTKSGAGSCVPCTAKLRAPKIFFPVDYRGEKRYNGFRRSKMLCGRTGSCIGTCGVPALHVLPFLAFVSLVFIVSHFDGFCKSFLRRFSNRGLTNSLETDILIDRKGAAGSRLAPLVA